MMAKPHSVVYTIEYNVDGHRRVHVTHEDWLASAYQCP